MENPHLFRIVYFADHPDEISYPLGDEIKLSADTLGRMLLADLKEAVTHPHSAGTNIPTSLLSSPLNGCDLSRDQAFDALESCHS